MRLRRISVGCFGGGTGLPSLLGGLKANPWVDVQAIVTMFDNGGSSGQLRDELGVLPPGDVLRCALALARNEREARELLLTRLPMLEHQRLAGHTGGNLLLSMMAQYSGDFLAAVDGLRTLLGCRGRVWPVSVEPATLCAAYDDGSEARGEVHVDERQARGAVVRRVWLEPEVRLHPETAAAIETLDAVVIAPGSFYTSLMPIFLVSGTRDVIRRFTGPVVYVANLLTEGEGMRGFTASVALDRLEDAIGRRIDVMIFNRAAPPAGVLERYEAEHKRPLAEGALPAHCALVEGHFWRGSIARHDRRRLGTAVWAVLANRLLAGA